MMCAAATQDLAALTVNEPDLRRAVKKRASLLLAQARRPARLASRRGTEPLFTSGEHLALMPAELPYIASKGVLHQLTAKVAEALADRRHHRHLSSTWARSTWADRRPGGALGGRVASWSAAWTMPVEIAYLWPSGSARTAGSITARAPNAELAFVVTPGCPSSMI